MNMCCGCSESELVQRRQKYKIRETTEAIVGAITGTLTAPRALLGRYDDQGRIQYIGRTTTLARAAGARVVGLLTAGQREHPWPGWSFPARSGSQEKLNVTLTEPELVVEVDVARDASGRWRRPARWQRPPRPLPHRSPPPDVTAALTAALADCPADAQPAARAPIPGCVRAAHPAFLMVDEVGRIPFEPEAANLFFQFISGRYERALMIVTGKKR
jgi:hypothetical protein